ncbi:MAG: NADH-quinone oxidoreductase subunit A [Actinomycetia bacterium]|nr:NADH-quinone oxidoreductase subunit A [Actinomycetes bacterium]
MSAYVIVASVTLAGVLLFILAMSARSLVAPRVGREPSLRTYESGVDPVGDGWAQTHVRYFVYAFLYVIFAVDAVYLFPWAHVIRTPDLGMVSLVEVAIFIGVIVVGLAHAARRGMLRWA